MRGFSVFQRSDYQTRKDSSKYKCLNQDQKKQDAELSAQKDRNKSKVPLTEDKSTSAYSSFVRSSTGCPTSSHMEDSDGLLDYKSGASDGVPWYVAMLHEKEKCVLILEDKVKILSQFEAESKRKDGIIENLQKAVIELTEELNKSSDGNTIKTQAQSIMMMQGEINKLKQMEGDNKRNEGIIAKLRDEVWQQGLQISHLRFESSISISNTTLGESFSIIPKDYVWESKTELSEIIENPSGEISTQEFQNLNEAGVHIVLNPAEEETSDHDGEEYEMVDHGSEAKESEYFEPEEASDHEFEEEKPEELTKLMYQNEGLKKKLKEMRHHYNMSRGTIISINRRKSLAEAQLKATEANMERLQKELKDRCYQLHDMSNKFSNLREENNHIKIMTDLQKENINFRELVAGLQSELTMKAEETVKMKTEIDHLQLHGAAEDVRKKQLQLNYEYVIAQGESMQRELQDLQIALKFTGTRLERFMNKIVKAVYTAPGIVQPTTQISDEDALEVFQKILDDRLTFHTMLTNSGIPVPPLLGAENPDAPPNPL
ncbi:coiled-coil domain-containing protein 27-like [Scyliorhinus canicula]|uniref:coiled-coil domain-containing protein 27-like n=1 Tax=Scyliorhinus canicula TaxID=7830 RepID=UPI0018F72E44|nr:coiled-coil domain-containing protein 27-like [Scyliorhinus canicula]XP_038678237.1 coiled-coil domain-containing protein 27-like [Scyliorhinus canicula]XP_038678238.1 coiled-coil domain-containing protein 27-like [Scyliorhinus canicula]